MQVKRVRARFTMGQYQYVEFDLDIDDIDQLLEFIDENKKRELKERYSCDHLFAETLISKAGKKYRQCPNCSALSFQDGESWTQWKYPVREASK